MNENGYVYFPDRTYLYAEKSPLIKRYNADNIAHLRKRFMVALKVLSAKLPL